MNTLRTGILMAALTGLFLVVGFLIGGGPGMVIAFLFAAGTNLFAYWNSDKMLLSMYGARQVDETERARRRPSRPAVERAGPGCRCRRSISSRTSSRTRSRPGAIPNMPPSA